MATREATLLLGLALLGAPALAVDDPNPASQAGATLYRRYCAACHGRDARGNGPVTPALAQRVPDLTRIAADAEGTFPFVRVAAAIDGRTEIRAHGVSDMPVWGEVLSTERERRAGGEEVPDKVLLITEYLRTLQR